MNSLPLTYNKFKINNTFMSLERETLITFYADNNASVSCPISLNPYNLGNILVVEINIYLLGTVWVYSVTFMGDNNTVIFDDTGNEQDINDLWGEITFNNFILNDESSINNYMYCVRNSLADDYIFNDNSYLDLYLLNDERNKVNKELITVGFMTGKYTDTFNQKSFVLTVEGWLNEKYNYLYIRSLNKYYYVNSITHINNNLTQLTLVEDVLMTYKDLIYNQTAFINRNEFTYKPYLNDERRVFYDKPNITYTEYSTGDYFNIDKRAVGEPEPVAYVLEVIRGN